MKQRLRYKALLLITMLLSSVVIVAQTKIYNQKDLINISRNPQGSYKLMNDITLSDSWTPIAGFKGTLDGNGHVISNLKVSLPSTNTVGFFATTNDAIIRNLGIKNANVSGGTSSSHGNQVGILVGEAKGTIIEYCFIENSKVEGREFVGSFVGMFAQSGSQPNKISNSYSRADVVAYSNYAGGLAGGGGMCEIIQCYTSGSVYSQGTEGAAGGMVGVATSGITNISGSVAMGPSVRAVHAGRIIGKKEDNCTLNLQLNYARIDMKIGYSEVEMKELPAAQAVINGMHGSNISLDSEEFVSKDPDYTAADITTAWQSFIYQYQDACTNQQIFSAEPRVNATNKATLAAVWVQAIFFDMAMNRYNRTQQVVDKLLVDKLYAGNYNHYVKFDFNDENQETGWFIYDDIMWWTGALARAYEYYQTEGDAKDNYLKYAELSYKRVLFGSPKVGDPGSWDQAKGGMFWNWSKPAGQGWDKRDSGKAACINFPTVIAALTLYRTTGNVDYLTQAKAIYDWAQVNLLRSDGYVYDMYHSAPNGHDNLYNSGTAIGAAVSLYKQTKDKKYLNDAILVADYVKNIKCASTNGYLPVRYGEEQGIYAAIFAQYMARLIEDCGQYQYLSWMRYNINSGWANRYQEKNITCPDFQVKLTSMSWNYMDRGRNKTKPVRSYDASAIPALMLLIPPKEKSDIKGNLRSKDFYAKGLEWDMEHVWTMSPEGFPTLSYRF